MQFWVYLCKYVEHAFWGLFITTAKPRPLIQGPDHVGSYKELEFFSNCSGKTLEAR